MAWRGVVSWRSRFGVGPVAVGARHIVDDPDGLFVGGVGFEDDGAVGVEELVGDVGEDGGAARGDAAFDDEGEEAGEELADVGSGGEFGEFGEKVGGEIGEIALVLLAADADGGTRGEVVKTANETLLCSCRRRGAGRTRHPMNDGWVAWAARRSWRAAFDSAKPSGMKTSQMTVGRGVRGRKSRSLAAFGMTSGEGARDASCLLQGGQ